MKRLGFSIFVLVAALGACGQQDAATYPPQYELNFMRACQAQAPNHAVCSCSWEKIESEIAPADFAAFERLPANEQASHPLYAQIERHALECRDQPEAAPEDPPAP
jgi:hypothetical protein